MVIVFPALLILGMSLNVPCISTDVFKSIVPCSVYGVIAAVDDTEIALNAAENGIHTMSP